MFRPRHFRVDDHRAAVEMVRSVGFGHLVVHSDDGLTSTPMPVLIDDEATTVRGHLARPNPLLASLPAAALLIVPVSDAYVSPGWYPSKREHGRVVPTWNYEIVHLHGELTAQSDEWTMQLVRDLTDHHEHALATPWSVDDAPADYIDGLLRAIVGVELTVGRIDAKRKLSQNKPAVDAMGAADGLDATSRAADAVVARAMRHRHPKEES